jgi:GT2 family glycosyltransferase
MVKAAGAQNADCVYSDYKIINSEGEVTGISHMKPIHEIGYGNCVGASFLYKLEAHRALGGFDRNKFLFEDYDYWVRMNSLGYKMIYIAEFPYRYRIHSQQLSSTHIYPRSLVKYRWKLAQSSTFIDPVRKSELIYSIIGLSIRTRSFDLTFFYFLVSIRYWKKIFLRLRERKRRSIQ